MKVQTSSAKVLKGLEVGDSVAVDGVCLTVETLVSEGFIVTTSPETLQRSTLVQRVGTDWLVNLESALRVGDRLGGHFVTGHVDAVGEVLSVESSQTSWTIQVKVPDNLTRFVVSKGSIAVNGVSLTIADCGPEGDWFSIAVIPHSFSATNLQYFESGLQVNLESDVLSKYVERLLQSSLHQQDERQQSWTITPESLMEHGFMTSS